MLKDMAFCHLQENLVINIVKKLMVTPTKTGIDTAKTTSKRVVQKTAYHQKKKKKKSLMN